MVSVIRDNYKKHAVAGLGVLIVLAAAYVAVIPTVVANHYMNELAMHADQLEPQLKSVATGPARKIFYEPDIKLAERQSMISASMRQVEEARDSLTGLESSNSLSRLPGNGFAGDYHEAVVRQQMASNMVKQSRQVLDRYSSLLIYIDAYTGLQMNLDGQLDKINQIRDFNKLVGNSRSVADAVTQIEKDRQSLAGLMPPPGFEQLHSEALATFDKAVAGFKGLSAGLSRASDPLIYGSVKKLEEVTDKNQVSDRNLLVNVSVNSSALRQLDELPEKVEHALGR